MGIEELNNQIIFLKAQELTYQDALKHRHKRTAGYIHFRICRRPQSKRR